MRTDKAMTNEEYERWIKGKLKLCIIRKDLQGKEAVPISKKGKERFISGKAKREYRWVDDATFQIFYGDNWWDAYSIDFDFIN